MSLHVSQGRILHHFFKHLIYNIRMSRGWLVLFPILMSGCLGVSTTTPSNGGSSGNCATALYCESFDGLANGSAWPSPWQIPSPDAGAPMLNADVQNGKGRLRGVTGQVARIVLRTPSLQDFDAYFTISYENFSGGGAGDGQGIGFYGRQNGGRLTHTNPDGQGYAVYIEGAFNRRMGFWYENNGVETEILVAGAFVNDPLGPGGIASNVSYRVRYQAEQTSGTQTTLRSKMWLASGSEPGSWLINHDSTNGILQNVSDGFAIDIYNYSGTNSITIDDIEIHNLN